jgi:hypothetical protein
VSWRFILFYGSTYEEHKLEFINELHNVYAKWNGPTLVGGGFNLIRESGEKKMETLTSVGQNFFNDWINKYALLEIKSANRKFTWANNQDNLNHGSFG